VHTQLRNIRYSRGLTQRQVAIDLNVTQAAIYQWENGVTKRPRPAMAKRLSDYFGVPIEILLAPEIKRPRPKPRTQRMPIPVNRLSQRQTHYE
jgi:transcriptional regulator with XRE-family HTH domain